MEPDTETMSVFHAFGFKAFTNPSDPSRQQEV